ncbi:MAG: hypothetical protein M8354_07480 [Halalkalicoccus sp.]|nr:hypothetical protein [Halalkalicoccus sp.]
MKRECTYCGESVREEGYLRHLRDDHDGELSGLDRRLVENRFGAANDRRRVLYASGGLFVVLLVLGYAGMFVVAAPSSVAGQPYGIHTADDSGTIALEVDGEAVDFSEDRYLLQDECFLFQAFDNAEVWHVHCQGVTLEYAMGTLGIDLTADSVTLDDRTFTDGTDAEIETVVDDNDVDPSRHILEDGDDVRITVNTAG